MFYIYNSVDENFGEVNDIVFLKDGSTVWVPKDTSNRHYQEYLAWIADGNEPEIINEVE